MKGIVNLIKFGRWGAIYILSLTLLIACQNESQQRQETDGITATDTPADSSETKTLVLPYEVVFNEDDASFEVKPNPQNSSVPLNKEELAEAINIKYPEIMIELGESAGDTLFVKIPNAAYLTQNMGTSGARTFLAEATYAFTELPEIEVVHFDFKEGDHAIPGYYKRSNFKMMENINDTF
ncbi:hypothetical protein [Olivibacter sitiensis]|uniref:hypothetical protein n=1 Tax=Olivibacter sitiensis TaxID=376470 RepID=UPI000410A65A|nr:hypothetical protein [Olivibacter sitiensis]